MTFVTTPSLIAAVYRNSASLSFAHHRLDIANAAYAIQEGTKQDDNLAREAFPHMSEQLAKHNVEKFSSILGPLLFDMINNATEPQAPDSKTLTLRLKDFVFPTVYATIAVALFGPHFPITETFEDFQVFDEGFQLIAIKAPEFLVKPAIQARTRLRRRLGAFASDNWAGEAIPGASEMISGLVKMFKTWDMSPNDIGGRLLTVLRASTSNLIWTAYWFWVYQLQSPDHIAKLRQEVTAYVSTHLKGSTEELKALKPSVLEGPAFNLHFSAVQETMRLATSISSIRRVLQDTQLQDTANDGIYYHLRQGEDLLTSARLVHLDQEIYENPQEYILDRFLEADGTTHRSFYKDGKRLNNAFMGWGGGTSMCPGRHLAGYALKLFSVLCLMHVELTPLYVMKIGDVVASDRIFPEMVLTRTGVLGTKEDLVVKIQRRK